VSFFFFSPLPTFLTLVHPRATARVRYDDLIAVYGKRFQEELGDLRIFMVGCGALGCEYVKNFALMGVCCGPNGLLTITDNDTIEVSNLNRQFLFRSENVGQPKSIAATQRATTMNKDIKIDAKKVRCRRPLWPAQLPPTAAPSSACFVRSSACVLCYRLAAAVRTDEDA